MNSPVQICSAIFAAVYGTVVMGAGSIEEKVKILRSNPSNADLSIATAADKSAIISLLKDYARALAPSVPPSKRGPIDEASWTLLLRLRDPDSVNDFTRGVRQWVTEGRPGAQYYLLSSTRDPLWIPILMDDCFLEDGDNIEYIVDGDIGRYNMPRSVTLAAELMKLIAETSAFREETRNWAENNRMSHVIERSGVPEFRQMLRDWWQKNKGFFLDQNYALAQPGTNLSGFVPTAPLEEVKAQAVIEAERQTSSTPINGDHGNTTQNEYQRKTTRKLVGPVAVLAFLILAATLLWFRYWHRKR